MLQLQGRVVPLASDDPTRHFLGRVRVGQGPLIDAVLRRRGPAPAGATTLDVGDAYLYPGLIDLHSHLAFASLPLWAEPTRTVPWLHRGNWPGARSYQSAISWPAYALIKGAPEALLAYAQVRALAGGTTAIQGWPPANRRPVNQLIRNIDIEDFGAGTPHQIRTSALPLDDAQLRQRAAHLQAGGGFIYHCAEGQVGSLAAREFSDAARAGCLRDRLMAIHCCAVGDAEFSQWQQHARLAGDAAPGGVVWSPFSNLWLYGETTDVVAARRRGLSVCLGSDWGPSGTKNLLGELKVAHLWAVSQGLDLTPFDLVEMATATAGDLLGRCWPLQAGRLEAGRLADITVVAARHPDPWTNLVEAHESDVLLVLVGGQARYGTRDLMRAAGQTATTSVRLGSQRRHTVLTRPDAAARSWTWSAVVADLNRVAADPDAAIGRGHAVAAAALAATEAGQDPAAVGLILELDMPAVAGMVAGPPPPGAQYTVPRVPSLAHDRTWHRHVRNRGFHNGLLDQLTRYYP